LDKPITILNNEKIIIEYSNYLKLQAKLERTVYNKIANLVPFFRFLGFKKAENITRADIKAYILKIRTNKLKISTQNIYIWDLKIFFQWLMNNNKKFRDRNKNDDLFKNIQTQKEKPDTSEKHYISKSDVVALLPFCKSTRDRTLVMLLYDTGARIGELLTLNVGDVKLGKREGIVTVNGKTGKRDIPITSSLPDLQNWLNQYKANPSDPLFPSNRSGRLTVTGAQNVITKLVEKANIKDGDKKTNIHAFRHSRLTSLATRKVPEMHLRRFAGWTANSNMPAVYINPTKKDVKQSILEADGILPEEQEEKPEPEIDMQPVICPRCGKSNAFDAKYCAICSLIIDEKLALEVKEADNEKLEDIRNEIRAEMDDKIKSLQTALRQPRPLKNFGQIDGLTKRGDKYIKSSGKGSV
jgi:integrase